MPWTKKKAQDAVPWAYRYAFPRLRRANLIAHQSGSWWQDEGDKMARSSIQLSVARKIQRV
jgi:hypothetical protein